MPNELDPKDLDRLKVELTKYAEEGASDDDMRLFRESFIGELKKKVQKAPTTPTFSTNVEDYTKPSQNGAEIIAPSPLASNLKSAIPTKIDPYNITKTKETIDVNAELKPFDGSTVREERKQRMGGHSTNIMSAIEKDPELYINKASTSHWGTQAVPEVPNIDNISKAVDFYAEKAKRTTGEEITPYDKQYLVNNLAEQIKAKKNIAEKVALTNLDTAKEFGVPLTYYTGVKDSKGNTIEKGSFEKANEQIIQQQDKEVQNYKNSISQLDKKIAAEVIPESNAIKAGIKGKADILNQELQSTFDKAFEEKDKALYANYNQLVQSGAMTAEQANQSLQAEREKLHKQTQQEVSSAFTPKFEQLNKEANLKAKDIQTRFSRNYIAQSKIQKEIADKRLAEIAKEHAIDMPKGYMDAYAKNFAKNSEIIDAENANKAYLQAKNMPVEARFAKAMTAGFGDVLSSIGGAMSFAGLDASAVNDVVIKTAMQNELPNAYFQNKSFGEKVSDPQWWIDNGVRSVPFMLATMPTGIAAGGGAGTLAKLFGAGEKAAMASSVVGGGAISWAGEAMLESGSAFNDAMKQGYSERDAAEIASKTFKNNLVTLPLSVFQMMPIFNKAFKFTKSLAVETISGGLEEVLQGWSQAQANAAANGQDVTMFEYAKTPQALEEGTIGAAMSSSMALLALNRTEDIDKQISTLMSSVSVGGEQHARAALDILNTNKAITDHEYKQLNLQLDYIMDGISKVQNFNIDDNLKAGLIGKFAKIGRAKAMLTDDENDLASQAAKEMIAEQEKEIKEILKGTTPLYLVFEKGSSIPTTTTKEEFVAILKDPKLREQFTLQAINDDKWQAQIDKVYKTATPAISGGTSASEGTTITDKNQETIIETPKETTPTPTPSSSNGSTIPTPNNVKEEPNVSIEPTQVENVSKKDEKIDTKSEVAPKEGDTVILKSKMGRDEKIAFKDGMWQIQFGKNEFHKIGEERQAEAQAKFNETNLTEKAPIGETTETTTAKETLPSKSPVFDDKNLTKEGGDTDRDNDRDIATKMTQSIEKDPTILSKISNLFGFNRKYYEGKHTNEGGDGGYHQSGTKDVMVNKNGAEEEHTFYLKGIEPDTKRGGKGSHAIESKQGDAIYYHEVGHKMFSEFSKLGHKMLDKLKAYSKTDEFGHPTGYSAIADNLFDATMMDFYSFYKLHPEKLKESQPKAYDLMKEWESEYALAAYQKAKKEGDNPKLVKAVEDLLGDLQKTTIQETGTEKKSEQTKRITKALNTSEVEAVAEVLAAEEKERAVKKMGDVISSKKRTNVAKGVIKETENADAILFITNNLDDIRKKLLASKDIKAIDCSWVKKV